MNETRPWLKNYPNGIPANINEDQYPTLSSFFDVCFEKYKKKTAFECMGTKMSFKQLDKDSKKFGAYLHSRGLKPGDRIALMMPNLLQYPIALFGAIRAGLIIVNTNPLYTPREMKHQFCDSGVKAIVIADNFCAKLQEVIGQCDIDIVITTSIGEMLGILRGGMVNMILKHVKRVVPSYELENAVEFKKALSEGNSFNIKPFESKSDDVVFLQYTGGTTGISKGAMLTNKNLIANMLQIRAWMNGCLKEGEEIILSPLPLYHIFALTINALALMSFGAHTILITNARDVSSIIKEFKNHKINVISGVNTLFKALLSKDSFCKLDFSSLKIAIGGGMAVQKTVAEEWEKVTGKQLAEGYGMTEASPVVSVNPIDGSARIGTIGLPLPSTDVRIVNDQGIIVNYNEVGELQVKGPQVMKGYYNSPEETASTILEGGWLCTGDIATMDEDGYLKIVDRKKDMILVSGFNVFPNEIENIIASHPKVLEVAAIGIPHEKSGEIVKVFVVKKDKSLKEEEIIQLCRENMTGYKVPKVLEFIKELPKNTVGKILRRELR